jgi:hypothetical protein
MKTELWYESPAHGAASGRERSWDRLQARALTRSLDRLPAAGRPLHSSQALDIRGRAIVSLPARRALTKRWLNVLDQASRPPVPRSPHAPLRRAAILAAGQDLRAMIAVLASGRAIDARGAAMASSLLTDGTGPLYNPASLVDLGTAVRDATRRMDPFAAHAHDENTDRAGCRNAPVTRDS